MFVTVVLALAGCTPEPYKGGTGVGNPGTTALVTAQAREATLSSGSATITGLWFGGCAGEEKLVDSPTAVDLLATTALPVPAGRWCAMEARFAGALTYAGSTTSGATFTLELAVPTVTIPLTAPLEVDDTALVTELGFDGWLSPDDLGLPGPGDAVTVRPGDPGHDALAARLSGGSAVYEDGDEDGSIDDDERDDEVGHGDDRDDDDHSGGSGGGGDDDDDDDDDTGTDLR